MKNYKKKILIVDCDLEIQIILKEQFERLGFKVLQASSGIEALKIFKNEIPALVILEIIIPKLDGYEVCKEIRKSSSIPILILSTLGELSNRIMGLKLGADDYLLKPFSQKELELRSFSLLKRVNNDPHPTIKNIYLLKFGNVIIDLSNQKVLKNNKIIRLTNIELSILKLLVENAGNALSRKILLENIWGYTPERYIDNRIVDVHISRLRSKLESNTTYPDLILTVRGIGYMFPNYKL